ncbi:MAG: hypothetical protein ACRDZQ_16780, partial [Acidimicrobiales bacterium]
MPAVAALRAPVVDVAPGEELTCELSVRNVGDIVEQFTLEVLGEAQAWVSVEPPVLSLFPDSQRSAVVRVRPPRLFTTPAGPVPLAVKVTPANEVDESVVEEATLNLLSYEDVEAELLPRISTGRVFGRHVLALDSRGNVDLPVRLSASDPANALRVAIFPATLVLRPGRAGLAKLKVKPRQRFLRGAIRQRPFRVLATPEGSSPISVEGILAQKPVLPKGVLALLVILAAVALWFLLIKPVVRSTAVSAVNQPLTAQQAQSSALADKLNQVARMATTTTKPLVPILLPGASPSQLVA